MDYSVQRNVKYLKLNGSKKSHDQRFFLIFGNLGTQIGDKTFACSNLLTFEVNYEVYRAKNVLFS